MPAIFTIAANIVGAIWYTATTAIGIGYAAATVIGYGLIGVAAVGVYNYQKRKARDAYNASLKDRLVMTATAEGPRRRVYGRCRVSGEVIFKATSGDKSQFYTMVIALAGHEVDAIEQVYVNDQPVNIVSDMVQTAPWGDRFERVPSVHTLTATGSAMIVTFADDIEDPVVSYTDANGVRQLANITAVTSDSVTFDSQAGIGYKIDYVRLRQSSFLAIHKCLGSPTQDLYSIVRSPASGVDNGILTTSDQFKGIACLVVCMSYDPTAFPGGVPTFSAVVRGAKVYDPRTTLTAWSENPALCARDAALHPNIGGLTADDIDDASFITAANVCDTSVTYTVNGSPVTRAMFTCGYAARYDQSPDLHIGELVEAMAGKSAWSAGRLRVRAGAYSAPVASITDSWLAGSVSIKRGASRSELVNIYRPSISDDAQNYVVVPLPELRIASYITEDGEELPQEVAMGAVTYAPQATHICGVMARELRDGLTVRLACNMRALPIELFDVVSLTLPRYGWSAKTFEVLGREFVQGGAIVLTLKETRASIYQMDAGFTVDDPSDNTSLPLPWFVPAISLYEPDSGESHLLLQSDGSLLTRVLITYPAVQDQSVLSDGFIDVQYSVAGSGVWTTETFPGDLSSIYLRGLRDGEVYLIRARLRNRLASSAWSAYRTHRVIGKTSPPPIPDSFTVRVMPDGTRILEGGYTTTARPLDFAGWRIRYRQGAGPYSWGDLLPFQSDAGGLISSLPIETNLINAGTWTLGLVGVDWSGNESEPLMIVGILPNPRLGDALLYYDLDAVNWPGTLTNGVRTDYEGSPVIAAADTTTWADLTTWDAFTRWSMNPAASWTYQLDDEDLGTIVSTLPVVDLSGEGNYVTEEQHSSDGVSWSSWAAIAGPVLARFVRIRVSVTAATAGQYTYIRAMRVVYTASVTAEVIEDLSPASLTGSYRIGTGDIRLPVSSSYAVLRVESLVIQSAAGTWTWRVVDKNVSPGPRVQFLNGGVLADPPLIDAVIKGIST